MAIAISEEEAEVKDDPDFGPFTSQRPTIYQAKNYNDGLAAYFLKKSHEWSERRYGHNHFFQKVLEVGAGTGMHIKYVRHKFDEYWMTDLNPNMLQHVQCPETSSGRVLVKEADARKLPFPDAAFDRLIAAHVLEHLPNPHLVLREWARVLKPDGVLTLILPCDPGLAWRLGRRIGVRNKFLREGIDYDYWMAREHINAITNLISFIKYYFNSRHEDWRPLAIPSTDLNLFYICHISMSGIATK